MNKWTMRLGLLAFLILALLYVESSAVAASTPTSTPVGYVYSTDLVAYIDGMPVDSYNIGGRTAVACEDVGRVEDGNDTISVSIWAPAASNTPSWSSRVGRPGSVVGYVCPSKTQVYVNGLEIPSYVIGGKTVVVIEDLGMANDPNTSPENHNLSDYLFSCTWDPVSRKISLHSLRSVVKSPYDPICVAYESIAEDSVGLDKAHTVYE